MRLKIVGLFALATCLILWAANVTPHLTGDGHIYFPENATPANLVASGGVLTLNSGGTNQNIIVMPSGTGSIGLGTTPAAISSGNQLTDTAGTIRSIGVSVPSTGVGTELFYNGGIPAGGLLTFNRGTGAFVPMRLNGLTVAINGGSLGVVCIAQQTCTYALDTLGDIRTTTMYRNTSTTAPAVSAGSITGNNNGWHVAISTAITSFTVTETGSYTPNTCVVNSGATTITIGSSLSGSVITVNSNGSMNGVTVNGICI